VLKHLTDIQISYLPSSEPALGYKLSFVFSPNDYFENSVLEKTYIYQKEVGYAGDFIYERALGTDIKWKEDKDLTKVVEVKKQRNKSTFNLLYAYHLLIYGFCRHQPYPSCQEDPCGRLVLQLFQPSHSPARG
jgi:hypothetical protein